MNYEECEHFTREDTTSWHGDVFDHPDYQCYCTKDNHKRVLNIPDQQCGRCLEKNNGITNNI